jgi:hypothetical protein
MNDSQAAVFKAILILLFLGCLFGACAALSGCSGAEFTSVDLAARSAHDAATLPEAAPSEAAPPDVLLEVPEPDAAEKSDVAVDAPVNTPDASSVQDDAAPDTCDVEHCRSCALGATPCCTAQQTCGCNLGSTCL